MGKMMQLSDKTAAVIVTYNRKDLLLENLRCLDEQTARAACDIMVIDNASSDGTGEALAPLVACGKISYVNTGANLGGAGGFSFGMKRAAELGYGSVWVMDDDCMPEPTALQELLLASEALEGDYGYLCSKVLWRDGSVSVMNVPRRTAFQNLDMDQADGEVLVPVAMASFVSLFVPTAILRRFGLPIKEFFLWTDDWEFTRRISRELPCYLVTTSVVNHKSACNIGANVVTDDASRLDRFRYLYRNDVVLYRREGAGGFCYEAARLTTHAARVLLQSHDSKPKRLASIVAGTRAGLGFNPPIEYPRRDSAQTTRVLELFGEPIGSGGQESYVFNQLSHMDRDGLSFDCLTPYTCENEDWRSWFASMGGSVFELGLPFRPGSSRELIREPLREFLAQHAYDVVHVQSGSTTVLSIASAVASDAGVPFVMAHTHSAHRHMTAKKRAVRLVASREMRKANLLCACSSKAATSMFAPSRQQDVKILKNGIDVERFASAAARKDELRREAGVAPGTLVVGNVGRLAEEKNHTFVIDVFREVLAARPDAVLWLVGGGEEQAAIEAKVAACGLSDSVRLWGVRSDVERLLACMDVFLFPSLWEGLGISLLEAQAAGVPCVVSDSVPHEVEVAPDYVTWLSLQQPATAWAQAVLAQAGRRNTHQLEYFQSSGFMVRESAAELRDVYLSHVPQRD